MSNSKPVPGSVADTLMQLRGVWHDYVELFELDGQTLKDDPKAGSPGLSPFENLVYIDFDGEQLALTNVHIKGRPLAEKTFYGHMKEGVLVFDSLGPGGYENIGVSGGPGVVTFTARNLSESTDVYFEPDFIVVTAPGERLRHTVLYRDGLAIRTLTARARRLTEDASKRHASDPRGLDGPVHGEQAQATIWENLVEN